MLKTIGIIFAILVISLVIIRYAYKQNMFNLQKFGFRSKKMKQSSVLKNTLKCIKELGGFLNVESCRVWKYKLIINLKDIKKIKEKNYDINGKSVTLEQSDILDANESCKLIDYAIK